MTGQSSASFIAALSEVRHNTQLERIALQISQAVITEGHMAIAQALEHALKRIPNSESLPREAYDRALDTLSAQL